MQMRTGNASGIPDQSNRLASLHRLARRNERFAEVKIRRNNAASVIDVDDIAGEKEVVDERHHATIGRAHRISNRSAKIDAEVSRRYLPIEQAARSELARYH
jgi:hypothetical protein